jgi:transcriptional regulator of acetoin/glycerol metabolism
LQTHDNNIHLAQARALMETDHAVPAGLVAPAIAESWRRCLAAGLDPQRPPKIERLTSTSLEHRRRAHDDVRRLARSEMQALHQQLGAENFVLALAAPDGLLLDSLVGESHRAEIEGMGIIAGTIWQERTLGTNALGTATALSRRITVRGAEHFFANHNRLTCIASPIFAPDHSLAGVLDASCAAAAYAPRARAMVAFAAAEIEARLFRLSHASRRVIALHGRAEFLDTAYAGLLALDEQDRIIAANDQARFMLAGLPDPAGSKWGDLFDAPFSLRPGLIGALNDRTGSRYHARLVSQPEASTPRPTRKALEPSGVNHVITQDPAARAALDMAGRAAQRGLPVLIRGETGTGKEVAARFAHLASGRTGKFVAVNCAAIPPELMAAELFGHAEGAFTGARRGGAVGLAVQADGGTLFLDEIGDLPLGLQAALLRFLDDFSVRPVGGTSSRVVDILLLNATNVDLEAAIAAGRFRADLYYRLTAAQITLPRLADRSDFNLIAERLMADLAPSMVLSKEALVQLRQHEWPGNIRQLRNVLARLALGERQIVSAADIIALLPARANDLSEQGQSVLRDVQSQQIAATMGAVGGNVSAAARKLGVSRNTIYRALGRRISRNWHD